MENVYRAVRTDSLYKADYVWSLNNRGGKCLHRGTDWFLTLGRLLLVFKCLNIWRKLIFNRRLSHFTHCKHFLLNRMQSRKMRNTFNFPFGSPLRPSYPTCNFQYRNNISFFENLTKLYINNFSYKLLWANSHLP